MRISTLKDDPGYRPHEVTRNAKVYLDGVEIHECFTADEELGEVVVVARNKSGKMYLDSGSTRTVTRNGVVTIKLLQAAE